ncbi:MAG: exonuclease SbcCD subunit D [Pirellulales bacterium]
MFKFLHAADLHLDSPMLGLERYPGAPADRLRGATREALENLVQLALDEQVQFVVLAGDVYDGDWPDHNTGLYFVNQMNRLREGGVPVFLIAGNHDAANRMTRTLRLPEHVTVLSNRSPQSVEVERCGAVVHGQSFPRQEVWDNLAAGYPKAIRGAFNIGLLHTCATGGSASHERYAPCSLDDLRGREYDYWALGHIHQRAEVLREPLALFPGNLQGRHVRETGPKGCLIVEVDDRFQPQARFEPLDVVRWQRIVLAVQPNECVDELCVHFAAELKRAVDDAGERLMALRVEIAGACRAHQQLCARPEQWRTELRAIANDAGGDQAWIERIEFRTQPPADYDVVGDGPLAEIIEVVRGYASRPERLRELASELDDLLRKLPVDLREGPEALRFDDPEWLSELVRQAQPLLLTRLQPSSGVS